MLFTLRRNGFTETFFKESKITFLWHVLDETFIFKSVIVLIIYLMSFQTCITFVEHKRRYLDVKIPLDSIDFYFMHSKSFIAEPFLISQKSLQEALKGTISF